MSYDLHSKITTKLDALSIQHEQLTKELEDPEVLADHREVRSRNIKRAALDPLVTEYRKYLDLRSEIDEFEQTVLDGTDEELTQFARAELPDLHQKAEEIVTSIQCRLVNADDDAIGSVILEVRAGVGGDEAALWAGDLLEMYRRYATDRKWTVKDIELSPGDHGGFKCIVLQIEGEGVWTMLGFEGGTHQVKRVPATETQGRVHTSTATVAVLAEPEEVEVDLDPKDVKEMITTSQGPGGQNVNKVATAVHLIHEPSGVEVRMQDTKSQSQNRQLAWQLLRARIYERQVAEQTAQRSAERRAMIGRGNRAEKIRTYRYKDNMAVDHRLGRSFNLQELLGGGFQSVADALIEYDTAEKLENL